jgi:BlaI family transcriptional regulator, penicillinase repressor
MKKLTNKEREIMDLYWKYGPMFVRELLEHYDNPRPHFNTLSTMVRKLEKEGFLSHKQYGSTFQYFANITEKEFAKDSIFSLVSNYMGDSYQSLVSTFVSEDKISIDELRDIINKVDQFEKQQK